MLATFLPFVNMSALVEGLLADRSRALRPKKIPSVAVRALLSDKLP
jgi:hypothetical protein